MVVWCDGGDGGIALPPVLYQISSGLRSLPYFLKKNPAISTAVRMPGSPLAQTGEPFFSSAHTVWRV